MGGKPTRTLMLLKPDALLIRSRSACILRDLISKGYEPIYFEELTPTRDQIKAHYRQHADNERVLTYMTSGPIIVLVWMDGTSDCVRNLRMFAGDKYSSPNFPYVLRGIYGLTPMINSVHTSNSDEAAEREIRIWGADFYADDNVKRRILDYIDNNLKEEDYNDVRLSAGFTRKCLENLCYKIGEAKYTMRDPDEVVQKYHMDLRGFLYSSMDATRKLGTENQAKSSEGFRNLVLLLENDAVTYTEARITLEGVMINYGNWRSRKKTAALFFESFIVIIFAVFVIIQIITF